jgi:hypothetical protein
MCKRFVILFSYDGAKAIECIEYSRDGDAGGHGGQLLTKLIGEGCEFTEPWYVTPVLKQLQEKFGVTCYVNEDPVGKINPFCKTLGCGSVDPEIERKVLASKNPIMETMLRLEKEILIRGQIVCLSTKNHPFTDYLTFTGVTAVCEFLNISVQFVYLDESKKDEECDGACIHFLSFLKRKECSCGFTEEDGEYILACASCKGKLYCNKCIKEEKNAHNKVCIF